MNKVILYIVINCFFLNLHGQSTGKYSLYYISIGSAHYTTDFAKYAPGFGGLLNVEEAIFSARKMDSLFKSWGAIDGQLILSSQASFITQKNIDKAFANVFSSIKKNKSPNPFLIIYYCGHGFSSKKLEALFLPPGDFVQNPAALDLEGWNKYGIAALTLAEKCEAAKIPFMIFFDCCYSGRQDKPDRFSKGEIDAFGLETLDKLMGDTYQLLTAMFRMLGPDPVFFSAPAGEFVETVAFSETDSTNFSGPLCRRAYILNEMFRSKASFSVKEWAEAFLSPDLDIQTSSARSFWVFDRQNDKLLRKK